MLFLYVVTFLIVYFPCFDVHKGCIFKFAGYAFNKNITIEQRECMKQRYNRLTVIKDLIKKNRIDNQDTLLSLLKEEGYSVTQATLSRDLKMLI